MNSFDIHSNDVTVNGILSSDELWERELSSGKNRETIFIYGTNGSKRQALTIKFNKIPIIDNFGEKDKYYNYSYELFLDCGNGNHYSANESRFSYNSKSCYQFSGLLLEVLEPFQKWRVKFVGYLRDQNNELVFVRMRLLWVSTSDAFDFKSNCDTSYLAKQLSCSNLSIDSVFEDRYVVCGQLKGVLQLDNDNEQEIYLWGTRSKSITSIETNDRNEDFEKSIITAYSDKGIAFEIIKIDIKESNKSCIYGFGSIPKGLVYPIHDFKLNGNQFNDKNNSFSKSFSYKVNGKEFTVENLKILSNGICLMYINGHIGSGVLINVSKPKVIHSNIELINSINLSETHNSEELVLNIEDKSATNETLAGGKGSSLSILKHLSKSEKSGFVVPNGFIVTTNAYQILLKENPKLEEEIEKLQQISWSESRQNLPNECINLANIFTTIEMPLIIKDSIRNALKNIDQNSNYDDILLAIRSSACGEDSEDMSAAGQMSTYLGIKGLDNICDCVKKCWSSQFSLNAIEYKRGYGQLINTPMAVVVQEMVDCDVAGVMFTCDPITGDPRKILITSNYGIGESVVSASVNPDYITLSVNLNSDLEKRYIEAVDSINIGAKESSIIINKSSGFGTEKKSNELFRDKCSLTESQAIKLGEIGLRIDSYFESVRDIEWGIKGGIFYMLQSRPITNLNSYSEWELMHELDTGHWDQLEYNTRANVGEVMPGTLSHLFLTVIFKQFGVGVSRNFKRLHEMKLSQFCTICPNIAVQYNSVFFNLKDYGFFQFKPEGKESFYHKAITLAIFGHTVEDQQLRSDCFERYGEQSLKLKLKSQKDILGKLLFSKSKLNSTIKRYQSFDLKDGQLFESSAKMMESLLNRSHMIYEVIIRHLDVTTASSVYNLILLSILSNGNMDPKSNPNLLTDFANVLSMTGTKIVSADVPTAIKRLAQSISRPDIFVQMTPEEALHWFTNTDEESGKLYLEFIQDHGHRGYKEFDIMSNTWRETPLSLMKVIQNMIPMVNKPQQEIDSIDVILEKVKTPLSRKNRILLKNWIIPSCHKSIADREEGKSFLIKSIDKFRQFFREMGIMMNKEGRIPEPDLIFFLSLHELNSLTKFRDPKIVMKAKQRKKIHPKMDKFQYEEIIIGPEMKPRNIIDNNLLKQKYLNGPNSIMKGTPVSIGSVQARVLVAKTFEDAKQIQCGDILVTYCTDIGWSPYFPMLSGIITEIGGLVSHGAVIAREYGLPCLVGVERACQLLFTGDTILLDADNAQIVLIRVSEDTKL